jgi:hypothetical protein
VSPTQIPRTVKLGDGPRNAHEVAVRRWQRVLSREQRISITGEFDDYTFACTRAFQVRHAVNRGTGEVDHATWIKAIELGFLEEE